MGQGILALDENALIWINSHHNPVLDVILGPISYSGEVGALWILVGLVMLIVGRPGWRWTALIMLATMLIVDRLVAAPLVNFFDRERPYLAIEGVRQWGVRWTTGSFPSGHAHSVWIAAIVLGSRWRRLLPPLVFFALLTLYSRPYFGMHYPLDVVAGAALGVPAGLAAAWFDRKFQPGRSPDQPEPSPTAPAG